MSEPTNRSSLDVFASAGAASIYGALMGLEFEAEGNMAATGMVLDLALARFLTDVATEGGPEAASVYAARMMRTMINFLGEPHLVDVERSLQALKKALAELPGEHR